MKLMATQSPAAREVRPLTAARCAFTIDVEDWYQSSVDYEAPVSVRVLRNVEMVLALLEECRVRGTFFVQGYVARRFPALVAKVVSAGHEVQSHGHTHRPLFAMNRQALREEVTAARKSVEDACGVKVTAFRAPDFSIRRENLWALEVLAECGFEIDSSIFPMAMRRYGIAGWPCAPRRLSLPNGSGILEAPVAVLQCGPARLPVAGGGYFRLIPHWLLRRGLHAILRSGRPAMLYCHPYEFSPDELRDFRGRVPGRVLLSQGLGRARFAQRMRALMQELPFGPLKEVLNSWT